MCNNVARKFQDPGFDVIIVNSNEKSIKSHDLNPEEKNCLNCDSCKIVSDPDPYDSLSNDDLNLVCLLNGFTIARCLRPGEVTSYKGIPNWCPKELEKAEDTRFVKVCELLKDL